MSINQLQTEAAEISKQIQEAETRKEALAVTLEPMIDSYFTTRIKNEKDSETRRDYAYLNKVKTFDVLNENTLRFQARNLSGPIFHDVTISDLVEEFSLAN